ncbi:MAG: amino acid permease [Elusimicrobia bacterium]|nr:amino acid permease [Candidatus Obscuribacterium magneticum]MCB4755488.1 amino acid permease [Candidatus Obscuribacterium magneticum]
MSELKRELGLFTCTLLVIGNIIGVGIFTTPGEVAVGLPSAGWVLLAWLIGGFLAMTGALIYAELGTLFPKAGGSYVFIKEAYGPMVAFLYGWSYTVITGTGGIALMAIGFSEYLGLHTGTWTSKLFSIAVVLILMLINSRDVKIGAWVMNSVTLTKILAMLLLVTFGFFIGQGQPDAFHPLFLGPTGGVVVAIGASLVPMAFTYSGWNATTFVTEEVKDPDRMIPLSLIFGTLATTFIYMLMNAVYLYAVPLNQLVGEVRIAHVAASHLFGSKAHYLITALVATSVFGCLSASFLANPRTAFAMGRDGLFFKFAGRVHPVYKTPYGAILFQGFWGCFLILIGDFEKILMILSVPLVVVSTMTILSIYVFRKTHPHHPRPYRCWGYPWIPAVYAFISVWALVATVMRRGWYGPVGLGLFVVGIPVYYFWKRHHDTLEETLKRLWVRFLACFSF